MLSVFIRMVDILNKSCYYNYMRIEPTNTFEPKFQGNIHINGKQNKHIKFLYNHVSDIMKENKCGGVFKTGEDIIDITPPTEKVTTKVKEALEKLKVIFTEKQ